MTYFCAAQPRMINNITTYICNAYTMQCASLPPISSRYWEQRVLVGLICNIPYYKRRKDDPKGHNDIQLNAECRFKVVRVLPPDQHEFANEEKCGSFKLKVEIFSSETGEWREYTVSSPQRFCLDYLDEPCFAYNGMLYWPGHDLLFVGFGPFNNGISDDNRLGFTVFKVPLDVRYRCLGVFGERVLMCYLCTVSKTLCITKLRGGAGGKLSFRDQRIHFLPRKMLLKDPYCEVEAINPNDKDTFYLSVQDTIVEYNICTRKWSEIAEKNRRVENGYYFNVELPWWPTPLPNIP